MGSVFVESAGKMDSLTIGRATYASDGIYVDGEKVFENDVWHLKKLDYVDVIRCRNCKYCVVPDDSDLAPYCTNLFEGTSIAPNVYRQVKLDGFCAWAEKKLITKETVELFKEFEY